MKKYNNFSLKKYNTFNLDALANEFVIVWGMDDISAFAKQYNTALPLFVLGGGSNVLFSSNYNGTVLYNANNTLSIIEETSDSVLVEVGAGIDWDDFVSWSVANNFCGAENLSLIPGNVGAAPVQNIGAYGSEAKDSIEYVHFYNIETNTREILRNAECCFAYRDSIFKQELKNKIIIDRVVFRLSKNNNFNLTYKALENALEGINDLSLQKIRSTIIEIRNSKLPDHKQFGNAGSFFKNPVVSKEHAEQIEKEFGEMPQYPMGESQVKLAAGWLIEKSGMKGHTMGNVGVHDKQALVLVNYGSAKGEEIIALAEKVQKKVADVFKVCLHPEVNYI